MSKDRDVMNCPYCKTENEPMRGSLNCFKCFKCHGAWRRVETASQQNAAPRRLRRG